MRYNFTFYIFYPCSQTNPATNRVAAAHLSEASNALNMRRVLVNAQVTAMISFIEFVYFFAHVVGISVAGGTSPEVIISFLMMYLVLYVVIIPYSFLMNTSHNKNRIVEHGWINVVKNMTTNNSISNSDILLGCCRKRSNNNASDEIFNIRYHGSKKINTISGNIASMEGKRPPIIFSEATSRKNNGCEEMICVYTNKSNSSLDRETNASAEQIASEENMYNNGDNLNKNIDLNDCLGIETIYA